MNNYNKLTKARLIEIIEIKDKQLDERGDMIFQLRNKGKKTQTNVELQEEINNLELQEEIKTLKKLNEDLKNLINKQHEELSDIKQKLKTIINQ